MSNRLKRRFATGSPLEFISDGPCPGHVDRTRRGANRSRTLVTVCNGLHGLSIITYTFSFHFVNNSVNSIINSQFIRTTRGTLRRGGPLLYFTTSNNTHVRRKLLSLVRVTHATTTVRHLEVTNIPCVIILAGPICNNIATSLTVLNSVRLTRPGTVVNFTNGHIVRRAIHRALRRPFRHTRFLLRRNIISRIMRHRRLVSAVCHLLTGLYNIPGIST